MPCYTEPPTHKEKTEKFLNDLLDEIGERTSRSKWGFVGKVRPWSYTKCTQVLCEWCKIHETRDKSLELQMWWRDHQIDDERHERERVEVLRIKHLRSKALAKLTSAEKQALGVKK